MVSLFIMATSKQINMEAGLPAGLPPKGPSTGPACGLPFACALLGTLALAVPPEPALTASVPSRGTPASVTVEGCAGRSIPGKKIAGRAEPKGPCVAAAGGAPSVCRAAEGGLVGDAGVGAQA